MFPLLAIFICLVLVSPTLVHAENIYFKDEFTTKNSEWNFQEYTDIHSFDWVNGKLTIRNNKMHTEALVTQQTTIAIDTNELWIHFAIKLNEGSRYGKIYLSFYDTTNTYYHYLLYFMTTDDITQLGSFGNVYGTSTTGRLYQVAMNQWFQESINVGNEFRSRFVDVTLITLKSIQVGVWTTNEIPVECSFDYLRISKSEYADLEDFPTIIPDLSQKFEFSTVVILVIIGVVIFILIDKKRRKKVRNYLKKYLKV